MSEDLLAASPDVDELQVAGDTASAARRDSLTAGERDELFALLSHHFEGVTSSQFSRDLDEKDWVLRVRRDGRLVGFTTLQRYRVRHGDEALNVLYSGDTIMAPEAWGSPVLARGWINLVRTLQGERADERWVWLLLSSGFRTYRFLPVFWRNYWPRHDAEPSAEVLALLTSLASERFGASFDAAAGVVRFPAPQRLRPELAAIPPGKRDDPHVRFFLARNPAHAEGDELVCLTELHDDNLTAAGRRMIRQRGDRPCVQ